jgi:tetratricopeptide (TPR) repeat protein
MSEQQAQGNYIAQATNGSTANVIIQGIPPDEYQRLSKDLGVTENAVKNFFKIIEQKEVPKEDWDFTLRQIATRHKELLSRLDQFNVTVDEEIQELRLKAEEAINEGDYDNADKYLDEALERQMVCITNAEKELTNCKLSAAEMKADKGDLELIRINYKAATKLFKEAVELVPDEHELKKAEYLQKWGDAARDAGLYTKSQTALEQCLAIREKLLPKGDIDLAATLNNLAELYRSQGKYEAEPLYKRSLGILENKLGKDHPFVATSLNNLAALYYHQGKYEEAELLLERGLVIYEKTLGQDHPDVAQSLNYNVTEFPLSCKNLLNIQQI